MTRIKLDQVLRRTMVVNTRAFNTTILNRLTPLKTCVRCIDSRGWDCRVAEERIDKLSAALDRFSEEEEEEEEKKE